jgi:hypothetical protein
MRDEVIYASPPMPSASTLVWLRATPRRRWWVAFLLCTALSGLWAVATPLFASPDEPAHAIRAAAVAEGKLKGDETKGLKGTRDGSAIYRVPAIFSQADDVGCFAFNRDVTADCFHFDPRKGTRLVATSAGNYPPAYYGIVGLPSRFFDSGLGVYLMRLVSALIAAALLASAIVTLERFPRPRIVALGIAAAITPMVLFLDGVINPNSMEIAASIMAWISVIAIADAAQRGVLDTRLVVRATVALSVLALARTISPLWVLAIGAGGATLAGWTGIRLIVRTRAAQVGAAVVGVAVLAQVAWTIYADPLASSKSPGAKFLSNYFIQRTVWGRGGELYRSMIGTFGWVDTPSPFGVTVLWTLVLGVLIVLGLTVATRRQLLVLAGLLVLTIIVPIVGELSQVHSTGFIWQGRYTLPLAVGVPIVAAVILARSSMGRMIPARLPIFGVTLLAICHVVDFAQALRRYTVGYDGTVQFWNHPAWSPPIRALALTLAFLVVVVAFAVWLVGPGADDIGEVPGAMAQTATR